MSQAAPEATSSSDAGPPKPTVALIIGMAGSGKTSLVHRLGKYLDQNKTENYVINLDPAVRSLPYEPNIDIRDTVNYKNVMKEYKLGPNGAILTSCNLFATRFDQVMKLVEKPREPPLDTILVDTAGQIEIFTWSASGNIITDVFASSMPTVVIYVVDTPRTANPQTFMSNMMQACSILYKTRLPLILAFNKADVVRPEFAFKWMRDLDTLQVALDASDSYAATLSRSLALVLEEFYEHLHHVAVSGVTGEGMSELLAAIHSSRTEFEQSYMPDLEARKQRVRDAEAKRRADDMARIARDIAAGQHGTVTPLFGDAEEAAPGGDGDGDA
eukprot:jgi/Ulvmu1/10299/UM060_0101.1